MNYQCCVPNCPYKLGPRSKLYFFPNPVENKGLFDKWVQYIGGGLGGLEDLVVYKNQFVCEQHYHDLSSKNPVLGRKVVSDAKVNEGVKEFKTIDEEVKPVIVRKSTAEKPKVVCTSSPPIYILQNRTIHGKEKPALLVLQRINKGQNSADEMHLTATIKRDPRESTQTDQKILENNKTNMNKLEYKVSLKEPGCNVLDTTLKKASSGKGKHTIRKRDIGLAVTDKLSERSEIEKFTILGNHKGLLTKLAKPRDGIGDSTRTPSVDKRTHERHSNLTDVALANYIQNSQIKSIEKHVYDKTNLPPEINEVVSEVEIFESSVAAVDVTEMDAAKVEMSEFEMFVDAPELNTITGVGVKQRRVTLVDRMSNDIKSNLKDLEASAVTTAAGAGQQRVIKTYLKEPNVVSNRPAPVLIPHEKPIPRDEWRSLISGLVAEKPPVKKIASKPAPKVAVKKAAVMSDDYNPEIPVKTTPLKQGTSGMFHVITEAMHSQLSQTCEPMFTGPVDRWYMVPDDFDKFIETIRNTPVIQKNLSDTIDAAQLYNLPYAEAERMKSLIKSYHEHFQIFKNVIQTLEKQLKRHKATIINLKHKMSAARMNTKTKAFEKMTSDMTEDAKMIVRMQVVHNKKKPKARRFTLKEKLFSLALYKLSRPAYRYVSSVLAMPTISTLNTFLNALHTQLLVKDSAATDNNSQENEETVAAVATISADSVTENLDADIEMENRESYTNNEEIEDSVNTISFPDNEPYTDAGYIETVCSNFDNYANEIEFPTQYVEETNDHNSKVIVISSNLETISFDRYGTQEYKYILSENSDTSTQKKVNISKSNKVNTAANKSMTKCKSFVPTLTDEKKEKIDFVLSKMLTPDQLKYALIKPQKKVKRKTDKEKKNNSKNRKRIPKKEKDNNIETTMIHKRNVKKNTPLSHYAQVYTGFIDHSYMSEGISDPNEIMPAIIKNNIQQSIMGHQQTDVHAIDGIPEKPLASVQVIGNEDNNEINLLDTVTKLRRKLEKYSPNTLQGDTGFIEDTYMSQRTLGSAQILRNIDKSKSSIHDTMKRKRVSHLEGEPIKIHKKKKKFIIDDLKSSSDPSNDSASSKMYILEDSQDLPLTGLAISGNVDISQHTNSPPCETEQSGRAEPELFRHFTKTNRKIFGHKRLPTHPY